MARALIDANIAAGDVDDDTAVFVTGGLIGDVAELIDKIASERNACADLARPLAMVARGTPYGDGANDAAEMIEKSIRARNN